MTMYAAPFAPRSARSLLAAVTLTLGLLGVAAEAPAQLNGAQEFVVNGQPFGDQTLPDAVERGASGFVVVWQSQDQDGDGEGIYGRLLDSTGFPSGTEFRVSTETVGGQDSASVASAPAGNFVVVWESANSLGPYLSQDGHAAGVFGQRFDASGATVGTEFQVNTFTTSAQDTADVAVGASGNFVVVWQSNGQDGNNTGVFGQRFNASGAKAGTEFQVNTTTAAGQHEAAVAMDDDDNFVVVWTNVTTTVGTPPLNERTRADVFAQLYAGNGSRVGTEFMVNSYTTQNQDEADVAMDGDGSFVVVWESGAAELDEPEVFGQDGDRNGVYAQRYTSAGSPVGAEFRVNSYTTYSQDDVAVRITADGGFIIAWESFSNDGDEVGVFAQRYDASGLPVDGNFQLNTTFDADQEDAVIAVGPSDDFVVAWSSFEQDGSYSAIVARRFTTTPVEEGPCGLEPAVGCVGGLPGRSSIGLTIKGGAKDKFKWKLGKAGDTALSDFLDPIGNGATRYHVCLYDTDGKFLESTVPAQGQCSGKPCWKATGTTGFKFKDKLAASGGIQDMKLKSGTGGKAQVQAKGKGSGLRLTLGLLSMPVTAQLIADDGVTSTCWQTVFTVSKKNSLVGMKAKGP